MGAMGAWLVREGRSHRRTRMHAERGWRNSSGNVKKVQDASVGARELNDFVERRKKWGGVQYQVIFFQKQLILTTTNNSTEFEAVAEALMVQLNRVHVKDRSSAAGSYGSRFPYRQRKGKGSYGTAHVAEDPGYEEEPEGYDV